MRKFNNFKNAHTYYKYPSSHRFGTIYNKEGVIRSYSNNTIDKYSNDYKIFFYQLKNDKIKNAFKMSKNNNKPLRLFIKTQECVLDLGLYFVLNFYKNYVKLIKQ